VSYDLRGPGGYMKFNVSGWQTILNLARQYGWQPAGTLANVPYLKMRAENAEDPEVAENAEAVVSEWVEKWAGNYFVNAYQEVTDDDAAALGAALERALVDFPTNDALADILTSTPEPPPWMAAADRELAQEGTLLVVPPSWDIDDLRQFVDFCKAGGFWIG